MNASFYFQDEELKMPWEAEIAFSILPTTAQVRVLGSTFNKLVLDCLLPKRFLFDSIIDVFLELACEYSKSAKGLEVLRLDSLALENIIMGVPNVADAIIESGGINKDLWLVPAHVNRDHWVLMVAVLKHKKVLLLDSMYKQKKPSIDMAENLQVNHLQSTNYIFCSMRASENPFAKN